ncbi:MAG: hypothetical protein ACJAUJ_001307 [Salibacteraceae bacterium]|jgi:hypothetical protein|tara:strand:+ start:580 stop:714 length:135 start_codon:yes stop_codon:yes gene_type:complete
MNKARVWSGERFRVRVEAKTEIPSQRLGREGDRKTVKFRKGKNQ